MTSKIITPDGIEAHGKDARIVHKMVRKWARELAGAHYEKLAGASDEFYRNFPSQKDFVKSKWRHYVQDTRRVMANVLTLSTTPDDQKVEIYEALKLHNELPWSMQENQIANVQH